MPAITSMTIRYEAPNAQNTFSSGDTIIGIVTLVLSKEVSVQSLSVKAKGDASVHWSEKRGDNNHSYSAHRRFFKLKEFLIPEGSKATVPRGSHVYNFKFNIPSGHFPPSYKGLHGKIVYKLEAALSRSWRMDRNESMAINFVSRSFENVPSLMFPQAASVNKEMGLFSKGYANMDVTMDKGAYAPGETVMFVAQINNSSSRDMTPKFSLVQQVLYHAEHKTKHESHTIHKVVDSCIKPNTQKEVRCALVIPQGLAQTIDHCEIISVEYHLKAKLDISFASDPEVMFPVVILPIGGLRHGGATGPYPAGAAGGPGHSDFPPQAAPVPGPYPAPPQCQYPGAQSYPQSWPAHANNPVMPAAPPVAYPAQPPYMSGGYNYPAPQMHSPYGSPFSSSSSTPVHHPPVPVPAFHPPPPAPELQPPPASSFNMAPTAPVYNSLPSAPMMDMDFLSQTNEPPPAYSVVFPSYDKSDAK